MTTASTTEAGGTNYRRYVAAELRAQMGRKGMTGRELARRLGTSPTWVSQRLQGNVAINTDDIDRIAAVLEAPLFNPFGSSTPRYDGPGAVGQPNREYPPINLNDWRKIRSATQGSAVWSPGPLAPTAQRDAA